MYNNENAATLLADPEFQKAWQQHAYTNWFFNDCMVKSYVIPKRGVVAKEYKQRLRIVYKNINKEYKYVFLNDL